MRPVTLKDVALRAGVSPKTVSRVINGEQHVRPAVRDKVQRIVDELEYRPNAFARSLSSSRSYLLGLFLDDPGSGYAADLQVGALMRCRERSYHLVVEPLDMADPSWTANVIDVIRALRLDGAILTPPICDDPGLLDLLDREALPYVRISPRGDRDRSGLVDMDDSDAAREMTEHLLGLGHRDIAFVQGDPAHSSSLKRFDGFCAAMARAGLAVPPHRLGDGDFSFRSGLRVGDEMLRRDPIPTAIFASNDDMALGILVTAMRLGIAVPDRLSVAGFDDAPTSRAVWPQITTIRQPKAEMAASAVDILVDPKYRDLPTDPAFRRRLCYELVSRLSTDRVRLA